MSGIGFWAELRRTRQALRLYRRGRELYRAGRYADAVEPLRDALVLIGVPSAEQTWRAAFFYGVSATVQLHAVIYLACAAARSGNRPLATWSTHTGLALLGDEELLLQRNPFLREWQTWAREYSGTVDRAPT